MVAVKTNASHDVYGEPEQDANTALTELDKGIRSGKVGEQSEAIVRFPRLFEKFPFPILLNSSFLKLTDIFRVGNNFLRLWVLKVCEQSEKHMDKILNVDEFVRRIFNVLHSNDPVARALALRTLGAIVAIISERENVHHAIRRGLESHDNVEVDAAIYATTRFATHSNAFAVSMCNKLSDMVMCETTGGERRTKLVKALRTLHCGALRSQFIFKLLKTLLGKFPSASLVESVINSLTTIAADTVVHVPGQVDLLLHLTLNDPRSAVRKASLLSLKKLAKQAALWSAESIQNLVRAATEDNEHVLLCLQVMQILVRCPAVCARAGSPQGGGVKALRQFSGDAALSTQLTHAAMAADVLTHIVIHCYEQGLPVEDDDLMLALESLVIATGVPTGQNTMTPLRITLRCLVLLSSAQPALYAARTAIVVGMCLNSSGERLIVLLEALAALGSAGPRHCAPIMPQLLQALEVASEACKDEAYDGTTLVLLCTVLFQERASAALTTKIKNSWEVKIKNAIFWADGWTRYRVARSALRYGHYNVAAGVLERLAEQAPSELAKRWLKSLMRAAAADAKLLVDGVAGLEEASSGWELFGDGGGWAGPWPIVSACTGCSGCCACTPLVPAWVATRTLELRALAHTANAVHTLCSQPPPAIALTIAQAARDPAAKAGACSNGFRIAAGMLAEVADRYGVMAKSAFYADDATLRMLNISQHTYSQLAQFLDRITYIQPEEIEYVTKEMLPNNLVETIALQGAAKLAEITTRLFDNPTTGFNVTHRHAEAALLAVRAICGGARWFPGMWCGGGGSLCRLSLNPAPRVPHSEPAATLPTAHRLALKVEGVVLPVKLTPSRKRKPVRQVKGVQMTVIATPHPRPAEKHVDLTNIPPVVTAVHTVPTVRDFFTAQQLIGLPAPGLYTVAVQAGFVDQYGELWNTGPRTTVVVKAHEDPNAKGNTPASRSRF